jgi:hypothetical protein
MHLQSRQRNAEGAISYYKSIPQISEAQISEAQISEAQISEAQISEDQNPSLFWKSHDSCGSMLAPLIEAAAEVMAIP